MSTGDTEVLFSVVIPTYNRKNELNRALNSVFEQTEGSFEVIVVDDHSTDGSYEWLMSLKEPRLKVLQNNRTKGACGARNTGVAAASSNWIAFLDSDDKWKKNKLAVVKEAITNDPNSNIFYSACSYFKDEVVGGPIGRLEKNGDIRPYLGRKNRIGGVSLLVVQKNIFNDIGGFDETLPARQDVDIYMRLCTVGKFLFLNQILVEISFDSANQISGNLSNRLNGWIKWHQKHGSYFGFSDRMYQQKRIFVFAMQSKKWLLCLRYFPGFVASVLLGLFSGKNQQQ